MSYMGCGCKSGGCEKETIRGYIIKRKTFSNNV